MRAINKKDIGNITGKLIEDGAFFKFRCYPGVSCFNRCCRNLNLFLYPFDVIQLKNRLGLSSDQFIENFVDVVMRDGNHFPDVLLKMSESDGSACVFSTDSGCTVYSDRPYTCRMFPVEQGLQYDEKSNSPRMVNFFRPPDFCQGKHETSEWTVLSWRQDQDATTHQQMAMRWSEIKGLFHKNPWGGEGPQGSMAKMAFMAIYNIDRFREFVFNSSFLKRYKVKTSLLKKISQNDADLMMFGFEWVKLFVWGMQSKKIRLR